MINFSEIIDNPETGESSETKANEDKPTAEDVNSGYDMTDNSAYRAAGTQNSVGAQPSAEDRPTSGPATSGGYDMTDNSAYRAASTQSSGRANDQPSAEEDKRSADTEGGGDATVNFDMTSNTAYSSTRFN